MRFVLRLLRCFNINICDCVRLPSLIPFPSKPISYQMQMLQIMNYYITFLPILLYFFFVYPCLSYRIVSYLPVYLFIYTYTWKSNRSYRICLYIYLFIHIHGNQIDRAKISAKLNNFVIISEWCAARARCDSTNPT